MDVDRYRHFSKLIKSFVFLIDGNCIVVVVLGVVLGPSPLVLALIFFELVALLLFVLLPPRPLHAEKVA